MSAEFSILSVGAANIWTQATKNRWSWKVLSDLEKSGLPLTIYQYYPYMTMALTTAAERTPITIVCGMRSSCRSCIYWNIGSTRIDPREDFEFGRSADLVDFFWGSSVFWARTQVAKFCCRLFKKNCIKISSRSSRLCVSVYLSHIWNLQISRGVLRLGRVTGRVAISSGGP